MSNANFFAVLIAAIAIGYALWTTQPTPPLTAPRPRYYIPNQERSNLEHVQEAFERAGYELVTNENASAGWHTMWTFHNPFWQREPSIDLPAAMQLLQSHQKVNHLPGASLFTSKIELAKHTQNLTFIPKSFLLPKQLPEFEAYQKSHPDIAWVKKGSKHRGVKILADPTDSALSQDGDAEILIQQFIRPYLIDNRLWDVGIYIAITSVNPLRMYYFDNVLIRACTEEFVEDLKNAPRDAYVVADDYMPPWGLPSFRPYYTWGMSTLNVLRAFFVSQGMEFDDVFREMRGDILELMGSYVQRLENSAGRYPHGESSFYSLYRVDFLLDRNLKPWITEVNQSPNLSSHHFADLATMFQRIAYSLLSLVGLTPGGIHHPETQEVDLDVLLHANDIDIGYRICANCSVDCGVSEKCTLCRPCRTASQSRLLKELISEQRSRLGFIPLYPIRNHALPYLHHLSLEGEDHTLQQNFVLEKCQQDPTWC